MGSVTDLIVGCQNNTAKINPLYILNAGFEVIVFFFLSDNYENYVFKAITRLASDNYLSKFNLSEDITAALRYVIYV